ncbi:MAG: scavenger mRNA decapping enzyme, partial [Olpidium bornovanus]
GGTVERSAVGQGTLEHSLLQRFRTVWLEGTLREQPAVLELQKTHFDADEIPSFTAERLASTVLIEENSCYHTHFASLKAKQGGKSKPAHDVKFLLIHPATETHIKKYLPQPVFYFKETPQIYADRVKPYIESFPPSRTEWVENILEGKAEADKVVHSVPGTDQGYVMLPDLALYLTAITRDRSLRSLRDIRAEHLPLLRRIRDDVRNVVPRSFPGVRADELRLFLHYQPSYYHLHVHVSHYQLDAGVDAGRAHLLDTVIDNVEICPDYYARATLCYYAREVAGVWEREAAAPQPGLDEKC